MLPSIMADCRWSNWKENMLKGGKCNGYWSSLAFSEASIIFDCRNKRNYQLFFQCLNAAAPQFTVENKRVIILHWIDKGNASPA